MNIMEHPKLKEADAVRKLQDALPAHIIAKLDYAGVESGKLVFHFHDNGAAFEFDRMKEQLKEQMRRIYKDEELGHVLRFSDIVAKSKWQPPKEPPRAQIHTERSDGNFEILATNPQIVRMFEKIQKTIKANV